MATSSESGQSGRGSNCGARRPGVAWTPAEPSAPPDRGGRADSGVQGQSAPAAGERGRSAAEARMPLEDHFSGDKAFARFASAEDPALDARIATWSAWGELVAACRGDDLL